MANRNLPPYKPIEVSFLGEQKVSLVRNPNTILNPALTRHHTDVSRSNPARSGSSGTNVTTSELDDVSCWRNNLVAASKRHNYLFVAVRSQIRVYAPKYPYQTIPSSQAYTTLSSAASPDAKGFIDYRDPHAINSITIGELGFEEVLVSAHDDGDVCAWYTRDLRRIAFRLSVGVSAWGVALHKERRLLAVSANTHLIQVFELAIGQHPEDGSEYDSAGDDNGSVFGEEDSGRRKRRRRTESRSPGGSGDDNDDNDDGDGWTDSAGGRRKRKLRSPVKDKTVKTLIGHAHNIPNISFLDDPTGRWLVGTSIDGIVILWDVKTERAVERCRMGYLLAGWSVLFLKPQAFKPVSTLYEALGKSIPPHTPPTAEPRKIPIAAIRTLPTDYYDAPTNQRSREARAWDISPNSNSGGGAGLLQLDEGYDDDGNEYSEEEEDESDAEEDNEDEVFISSSGGHLEIVTEDGSDTDTSGSNTTSAGEVTPPEENGDSDAGILAGIFGPVRVVELVQDSEGESGGSGGGVSREKRGRETNKVRESARRKAADEEQDHNDGEDDDEEEKPAQPPISLVFSTTEQNCHLLTLTPTLTPTVICRSPLHQAHPPPNLQYLGNIDRLNMVHCIPDLSLVVAASQKGRAAIFRLTRVADDFCMRLDTVLPRESSGGERGRERRPTAALLGVAVSPVQERRGPKSSEGMWGRKRWRLMMVYMDGSVLSYELGREQGVVTIEGVEGSGLGTLSVGGFLMV